MATSSSLVLKKTAFPLALCYTVFILAMSLTNLNEVPKLGSSFDDKVYHSGAYMVMTLLWYNHFRFRRTPYKIVFSVTVSLVCGIIIEVLQETLTETRTGDVYDIFANCLGVLTAIVFVLVFRRIVNIN